MIKTAILFIINQQKPRGFEVKCCNSASIQPCHQQMAVVCFVTANIHDK